MINSFIKASKCEKGEGNGGLTKKDCDAQCVVNPGTPPQLKDRFFRGISPPFVIILFDLIMGLMCVGLQISKGFKKGEWRAKFTETSVTISSPSGAVETVRPSLALPSRHLLC